MLGGLRHESERVRDRVEHGDPLWPAQLAVALAIALGLGLAEPVTVGPSWLLPAVETVLLVVLVIVTPSRATSHGDRRRRLALIVTGFVSLANVATLALLVHYLVSGGKVHGHELIQSGVLVWSTNILLFAVWYWELDRGGPVTRFLDAEALPDLQFPQMENPQLAPKVWRPGFGDYLYTSLTNATAFSPTDTMPLTQRAKLVMAVQSVAALATVGLVVARAVNILG